MKKLTFRTLTLFIVLLLTACGSYTDSNSSNSRKAKYQISNEDVKKWVIEKNKFEQCLYPKERKSKGAKLSEGNRMLYQMAVYQTTLSQVIGEDNYLILTQDPASQRYLAKKLQQHGHSQKAQFSQVWCNTLKATYLQPTKAKKAVAKQTNVKKATNKKSRKTKAMRRSASVVKTDIDSIDNQDQLDIAQEEVIEPVAMPFQPEEKESSFQEPQAPSDRIKVNWEPVKNEVYSY
ncbi:DUF5358 domain-containing protein [Actinobacillus equuli subsp. equuli]|uniref:DUF5358 domain-containing protein n=2 Tax=Actinobacillus equuli TaxID=718 RepID=A0A0A7MGY4_ACTEU|nr:DUF5358 family protein [Actinobacillus equuli]AIZ79784.1 hypothetical protein ACEE_08380 [Actinobacillus equuli subsp. equuli]MDE8034523.1 DUF5358 domain-containing protein [Actinobacillus equuli subsp. equuli]MDG4947572.1 DUF5358 domain-containing protein [Actinobacillus equuli subsp. haemolyticus]WGE41662.1 DUF5358 domain-containing protein [Actinobacillus equuli subsp. haemolyticus]WGE43895.1 DUF5358 domain-containing protein [Actinobacillus equuli subsp. equuli]